MRLLLWGLLAGLALGGLAGVGIYFASDMSLTSKIIYAELIVGAIQGVLMTRVVRVGAGWVRTLVGGAILGLLLAMALAGEAKMVPYIFEAGPGPGPCAGGSAEKIRRAARAPPLTCHSERSEGSRVTSHLPSSCSPTDKELG